MAETPEIEYDKHARFLVRFTWLGDRWIEGRADRFIAQGSTEKEVIERLAEQMREAGWQPPVPRRHGPRRRDIGALG